MSETTAIEIRGLTKRYGKVQALAGLDLAVGRVKRSVSWGQTAPGRPRPSAACST